MSNEKNAQVLNELKKSSRLATTAFCAALVFMGIQFWPTEYNFGMRMGLGAIFILIGFWLFSMTHLIGVGRLASFMKWAVTSLFGIALIMAIVLYIKSTFAMSSF